MRTSGNAVVSKLKASYQNTGDRTDNCAHCRYSRGVCYENDSVSLRCDKLKQQVSKGGKCRFFESVEGNKTTSPDERSRAVLEVGKAVTELAKYTLGDGERVNVHRSDLQAAIFWLKHYPTVSDISRAAQYSPEIWGNV